MGDQSELNDSKHSEPTAGEGTSKNPSQLDSAGQAILRLLHKAADAAEANTRRTLGTTQELSENLRAAQVRITELEAELQVCREKAERAEQWLAKIFDEIEERLITKKNERK
jgi:hypothetical protein